MKPKKFARAVVSVLACSCFMLGTASLTAQAEELSETLQVDESSEQTILEEQNDSQAVVEESIENVETPAETASDVVEEATVVEEAPVVSETPAAENTIVSSSEEQEVVLQTSTEESNQDSLGIESSNQEDIEISNISENSIPEYYEISILDYSASLTLTSENTGFITYYFKGKTRSDSWIDEIFLGHEFFGLFKSGIAYISKESFSISGLFVACTNSDIEVCIYPSNLYGEFELSWDLVINDISALKSDANTMFIHTWMEFTPFFEISFSDEFTVGEYVDPSPDPEPDPTDPEEPDPVPEPDPEPTDPVTPEEPEDEQLPSETPDSSQPTEEQSDNQTSLENSSQATENDVLEVAYNKEIAKPATNVDSFAKSVNNPENLAVTGANSLVTLLGISLFLFAIGIISLLVKKKKILLK